LPAGVAHPEQLAHLLVEEASAWTVRLDPFAIQDELRDGSLAHMTDKLVRSAGSVLDVDLGISDLVFFEEFLGFAAIAAPHSRIKQKRHLTIIPTAPFGAHGDSG
jgi:hypothetical protein